MGFAKEPNDAEQTGVQSEGAGRTVSQLGGSDAGGKRPAVSTRGGTLRANGRNVGRVG